MKKLISILLTVAMVLSMCIAAIPASAAESESNTVEKKATVSANHVPGDFDGDGKTDSDAIAIDTMAELQAMQGKKGYLTKDFVVKMSDARPASDTNNAFTIAYGWPGADTYLDGCGYTVEFDKSVQKGGATTPVALFNGSGATIHVKNLNLTGVINAESDSHVAPLCKHGGKGDVENVVVDVDITVKSIGANAAISGVWGKTDGSTPLTMKNVHFTGSIDVKCAVSTGGYGGVGGLIASTAATTTIEDCSVSGAITVTENGATNGNVGGLVGKATGAVTISDSLNNADITVKGKVLCIGGFVGISSSKVTITNSTNSGDVKMTTTEEAYGHNGIGGFVGMIDGGDDPAKAGNITDCYNSGEVSIAPADSTKAIQNVYIGGIAGRLYKTAGFNVENCTNDGKITNSAKGNSGWGSVGGIVGSFITVTNTGTNPITLQIKNCVNNAAISAPAGVGGILGSAKQFNFENKGTGAINLNILGCKNLGAATATENVSVATGGIIGDVSAEGSDTTTKLTVSDCFNTGAVVGTGWNVGGILGRYNWINVTNTATVENCVNTGSVKLNRAATKEDPWLCSAGIVGHANGGSKIAINNCINTGAVSTAEATGLSTYPITNCVNTVVSGGTVTTDLAYITGSGNVYTADSVKRSDAAYTKYGTVATLDEVLTKIDGYTNYSATDKKILKSVLKGNENYVALYNAYTEAVKYQETLVDSDYTADSWKAFDDAIKAAATLIEAADPKDEDMIAAKTAMDTAKAGLVKLDLTALRAAIADASDLVEEFYAPDVWESFQTELEKAKETLNSRVQADIDAAADALNALIVTMTTVDYTALEAAIAAAKALNENDYTVDDWQPIANALKAAEAALESDFQIEVDVATDALLESMEGKTPLDRSNLAFVIEGGALLEEENYTAESWLAFEDALVEAMVVLDSSRSQDEIDAAIVALEAAIAGLVDAPEEPEDDPTDTPEEDGGNTDAPSTTPDNTDKEENNNSGNNNSGNNSGNNNGGTNAPSVDVEEGDFDYTALQKAISAAKELKNTEYTQETWDAMTAALVKAETVLTNAEAQADVDAAVKALNDAIAALVKLEGAPAPEGEGSDSNTEKNEEAKKGCKSAIAASAVVLTTVFALGLGFKKKED